MNRFLETRTSPKSNLVHVRRPNKEYRDDVDSCIYASAFAANEVERGNCEWEGDAVKAAPTEI